MDERVLSFSRVSANGASPDRWMILLHGIFGSGGNLRTLARRLTERAPRWGFVLPDLRAHGGSVDMPPPSTFEQAAADVARLESSLGHPVHAIAGHSFGGKVAMLRFASGPPLEALVVLDSAPGADPERMLRDQAGRILSLLETIPRPIPSREAFLAAITGAGYPQPIAEWLAMQVRRAASTEAETTYELRLDLAAIRAMLSGYFATDTWGTLEHPPEASRVLVVVGGASNVVRPPDLDRLRAIASRESRLSVKVLERAGHWLHVDDLEGVVDVVAPLLSTQ